LCDNDGNYNSRLRCFGVCRKVSCTSRRHCRSFCGGAGTWPAATTARGSFSAMVR